MGVTHWDVAGLLKKHGYRELQKIGEGSFGKAVLVEAADGERLVCKLVDVSKATSKETQDAVKEGKLLAQNIHPYIVRYRDSFLDNGWLCIIMDYCEGGELKERIDEAKTNRQGLSEAQILRWLTQGLLALKHLHSRHILHRDLKPANFFIAKSGSLKLGDFGISKVLSNTLACAKTQIGTPYYLSPEICKEQPYAWPSDIWAMGCILYEMCALKVPFDAANITGLVQKILRGSVQPLSATYSDFTRQLCAEMLSKDPAARPSAEEVLQRPQIQAVVRQLLEEAQGSQGLPRAGSKVESRAGSKVESNVDYKADVFVAPSKMDYEADVFLAPASEKHVGPYVGTAGAYKQGNLVEYHSISHGDWLPATVIEVDSVYGIKIDIKVNAWIPAHEQATRVRPRRRNCPERRNREQGYALAPMPAVSRSPSVPVSVRKVPQRGASEAMRRSPSVGSVQPRPSPHGWQRSPAAQQARPPLWQRNPSVGRRPSAGGTPPGGTPKGSRVPSPPSPCQRDSSSPVGADALPSVSKPNEQLCPKPGSPPKPHLRAPSEVRRNSVAAVVGASILSLGGA